MARRSAFSSMPRSLSAALFRRGRGTLAIMFRWLFTILAALSLVLFLVAVAAVLRWDVTSLDGNFAAELHIDIPWYVRLFKDHGINPASVIPFAIILPIAWRLERSFRMRKKR
jgi:hypothetical protein